VKSRLAVRPARPRRSPESAWLPFQLRQRINTPRSRIPRLRAPANKCPMFDRGTLCRWLRQTGAVVGFLAFYGIRGRSQNGIAAVPLGPLTGPRLPPGVTGNVTLMIHGIANYNSGLLQQSLSASTAQLSYCNTNCYSQCYTPHHERDRTTGSSVRRSHTSSRMRSSERV
jgi:hypothetical protein